MGFHKLLASTQGESPHTYVCLSDWDFLFEPITDASNVYAWEVLLTANFKNLLTITVVILISNS